MKREMEGMVFVLMVFVLAAWAGVSNAYMDVQVVKGEHGESLVYSFRPDSDGKVGVDATPVIRGYQPYVTFYSDVNSDGAADLFACGENQGTGQVWCQAVDLAAGATISAFNVLSPAYDTSTNSIYIRDFNNDNSMDMMACGYYASNGTVVCQVRNIATGAKISQFTAVPAGMDLGDGFRLDTYINTDNDWNTAELGICYRRGSDQQLLYRIHSPVTGALISKFTILDPNYAANVYTPSTMDFNGDGKYAEMASCARNRVTGQYVCQVKNILTGKTMSNVPLLDPTYVVKNYSTSVNVDQTSPKQESVSWGIKRSTRQPVCEVRQRDKSVFRLQNFLGPKYIPVN